MISMESTNLGETIRLLRKARGMTITELAEAVGISESHLKKIEAGKRKPGIETYQRIISVLEMEVVLRNEDNTVKGDCIAKTQKILLKSTETEALVITRIMEAVAEILESVL